MSSATDSTTIPMSAIQGANGLMAGFNRYGLPGVVIGAQFLIIVGLIYVMVQIAIPALQASTSAMANMTNAVNTLTQTIRDAR